MQSVISAGFYWLWNEKVATEGRMGGWPERHQENKAQTMKPGAERPWSGSLFLPSIFISSIFFCELPPWFIKTNRTICACVPQTKNSLCLLPSVKALYWKHRADGAFALVILYVHSYNQLCSNSCFYLNKHVGVFILIYIDLVSICIVCHKNDSCFISHLILNSFPAPTWKIQKHKCHQNPLMLNMKSSIQSRSVARSIRSHHYRSHKLLCQTENKEIYFKCHQDF